MSASGCRCGCLSEFVRYLSSIFEASASEMGRDEMCRYGGRVSGDILCCELERGDSEFQLTMVIAGFSIV